MEKSYRAQHNLNFFFTKILCLILIVNSFLEIFRFFHIRLIFKILGQQDI
jgi:hypothetical protein